MKVLAPLRLGLCGGGTDIRDYFEIHGGVVLNMAIKLYATAYVSLEKDKMSKEEAYINSLLHQKHKNINIYTACDVEDKTGIGSSSAKVVAALKLYDILTNTKRTEEELVHASYDIERIKLGQIGGYQDYYSAVYGGVSLIEFSKDKIVRTPIKLDEIIINEIEGRCFLVNTKVKRPGTSSWIIKGQIEEIDSRIEYYKYLKELTYDVLKALKNSDINEFAYLLLDSWEMKKSLCDLISNQDINKFFERLKDIALGYKMCGAGGGGYALLILKEDAERELYRRLQGYEIRRVLLDERGIRCIMK